jgi:hypothetical protein
MPAHQPGRVVPNRTDNRPQTSQQSPIDNRDAGVTNKVMRTKLFICRKRIGP